MTRCDGSVRLRADGMRHEGQPAECLAQLLHPGGADAGGGLLHAHARTRPQVSTVHYSFLPMFLEWTVTKFVKIRVLTLFFMELYILLSIQGFRWPK